MAGGSRTATRGVAKVRADVGVGMGVANVRAAVGARGVAVGVAKAAAEPRRGHKACGLR